MPYSRFGNILSLLVIWYKFYTHVSIFRKIQLDSLFRKTFKFKLFVLVTYHWIYIHSRGVFIILFGTYHAHFCLECDLSDPLIPYILLLLLPGYLIHPSIINMYVNTNTDNIHNTFVHMYCFLHTYYLVLYIIPFFIKINPHSSSEWKF